VINVEKNPAYPAAVDSEDICREFVTKIAGEVVVPMKQVYFGA
jgi:hypothetical protein